MAGYQPARGGVLETMEGFYNRRQREVARSGEEAATAAREAYGAVASSQASAPSMDAQIELASWAYPRPKVWPDKAR